MEIKSDYELANVMNIALAKLANQALNGATEPFKQFKEGISSITVTLSLSDKGTLTVTPYDTTKIKALEETVKTQEKEIKNLTPVTEETTVTVAKPKRRRST